MRMVKNKDFLTIGEIDLIAKHLGSEGWNKFKRKSAKRRVLFGLQILKKIYKEG